MKKIFRKLLYIILSIVAVILVSGIVLAFLPAPSMADHKGISPKEAAKLRQKFAEPHHLITATDGEILFLSRWNPAYFYLPLNKNYTARL